MPQGWELFAPEAAELLRQRYLARDSQGKVVESPEQMLWRVARAVAAAEERWGGQRAVREWAGKFFELMASGRFLPNSPTLMNAGRPLGQLAACFVLPVPDSIEGIFDALKHAAIIHKSGGGTGFSFSRLRPAGDRVGSTGGRSSGPVSFMRLFDVATEVVRQGGMRRGANMGVLAAGHPDIERFVQAKLVPGAFTNFNLSVAVPDRFMQAAVSGGQWELVNPRNNELVRRVEAGGVLEMIARAAHTGGEPGILFIDAINRANPTPNLGEIEATNPCGEQPLLPYESCNLGSVCLARFVRGGDVDTTGLEQTVEEAVRFLDDVIEVNRFPLPEIRRATLATRKVGLGVMGLADMLAMLGIPYASARAREVGAGLMARIQEAARAASSGLAYTRGSFPAFAGSVLARRFKAMRNATLTTIAPTGSLSLLVGCSAGIEPFFALAYTRRMLDGHSQRFVNRLFVARLKAEGLWNEQVRTAMESSGLARDIPGIPQHLREVFLTATEVPPEAHLEMQAAFQAHVDNAVSKTINLPADAPWQQVQEIFVRAWERGLKGLTVFRQGSRGRQVVEAPGHPCSVCAGSEEV